MRESHEQLTGRDRFFELMEREIARMLARSAGG